MTDSVAAADGTCDMVVAGMGVTKKRIEQGVLYSWPTLEAGALRCRCRWRRAAVAAGEAGGGMRGGAPRRRPRACPALPAATAARALPYRAQNHGHGGP